MTERRVLRGVFTREVNKLEELLALADCDHVEIRSRYASLVERYDKLKRIDDEVYQELLQKEDLEDIALETEIDNCSEYDLKYFKVREKVQTLQVAEPAVSEVNSIGTHPSNQRVLRLPKLELKRFDGNVKDWIGFWAQFNKLHEDICLKDEDKFVYLIQCMETNSPAQKLVENFPPSKENYKKAIELLKSRYGKEELLIEYYVRELLSLVLKKDSLRSISQLYDSLEGQLRALDSLGVTKEKYAAMLFPLVESALPEVMFKTWDRYRVAKQTSTKEPDCCLTELLAFLKTEVEGEERLKLRQSSFEANKKVDRVNQGEKSKTKKWEVPSAATLVSTEDVSVNKGNKVNKEIVCVFCSRNTHPSQECAVAIDCSLDERQGTVKKKGACFRCLRQGHVSAKCKVFVKCPFCKGKHYALMCTKTGSNEPKSDLISKTVNMIAGSNEGHVTYLQTLVARVVIGGCTHRVRVLCDSGSQRSYIKKSCAKKLELKQTGKVTLSQELFGGRKTAPVCFDSYQLTLTSMNQKNRCEVTVLGSDSICNGAPLVEAGLYSFLRDKGVELTDFVHNDCITSDIQVLLGADVWSQIITPDFVHINESLVAVRTCLGWTVMGSSETTSSTTSAQTLLTLTQSTRVADLWEIEFMGIKDPGEQIRGEERQQQVKNFFDKTVKREEASGRYIVKLPWIDGCTSLETNREVTLKRLLNTSRRLRRMQKFQDYDEVFQEWVNQGIIEGVEDKDSDAPTHYLPHRAVLKDSGTTKIRPVFDASNKDRNGNSLNDCLEPGPNLIDLVPVVLTNFRSYPIGLIADIEKAFLQIIIDPEDRDMLRFLWWDNGKVITARHCRVVFGVCSSPFLLVSVMNHLLDGAPTHLKEVAAKMKLAFYVDNCLTGVVSKEEIEPFILKAQELMLSAGFNLRGWVNSLDCGVGTTENVLGLRWYCDVDELGCNFSPTVGLVTRRMVLSSTQRIFDPIGFSAPVTLVPKLILQKTWQRKIGWDEVLPEDICDEFCRWTRQLQYLQDCRIPRRIFLNDTSTLHVFVDASKRAFGCCIFLRTEDENKIKLSLLMAKSRVAPLKELTLPRLELMGALLGVRMSRLSLRCLHRDYIPTVFWSDSAVALAWIAKGGHWSVFVENRVKEIQEYSKGSSWRHLPGSLNPADLLSRGCSPKQLWKSRWWEGPVWLKRDEEEWVSDSPVPVLEEVNRERRKTVVAAQNTVVETILLHLSSRFSGYLKIVRTIAWIRRFRKGKQRDRGHTEIGSEEFLDAEKKPFFLIQRETLRGEERKEQLKNLQVFTDDEGILRMKSRVVDAEDIPEYTYPVVLPSRHVMVERMIQQYHHFHNHAGTHTLLILLRQRVWILQGRRAVAAVVRKCVICRRYSAKVLKVPFPPLPRDRTQTSSTFQITGTDLAGPVFLRGGEKGWIVIFTCAVYRAVHLELITSLSTVAYVQALRRFVARRGRVNSIYSDNGTNFTGLRKALEQLDWSEIEKTCSLLKIKWNLNPPTAAWWGGFWERLIRILKELLRRNLGKACLNYEEMCTLLCDCENLMNNRPLTYVSEEDELKPLRPSMFLQSLEGNDVHDLDQIQSISLNDRWRYLQAVRESLRNRFKQKYLGFLRSRSQKQQGSIRVGDIVLVGSDNKKRINWPLGRVVELLPGRDNVTRLVRLRTATGILLRPVQRLYYLEMNCVEKEDPDTSSRHRRCEETLREEVLSSDSESGKEGELKTRCGRTVRQLKRLDL